MTDIVKRSVIVAGHRTSVSLEPEFWNALKEIAERRGLSINKLIGEIDRERSGNLSSTIRVYVLRAARAAQTPPQETAPEEAGRG
ncbi:MAG: ribbon-helix-helix domain-containing protein [Candidatus Eiseniibacteriota bacterium]